MNAEIIAVGSEMLTPTKIDTNSLFLTQQLNELGVEVVQKCVVGDDRARLTDTIAQAVKRSEIVILTGGLGPTEDDLTRDAVAAALGISQTFHQQVADGIAARFAGMGRRMAEINKRQAYVLDGADILDNDRGTAPGQWIARNGRIVLLLPGPPKEMKAMWERHCLGRLRSLLPAQVIRSLHMRVSGMGESDVDALVAPVYTRYANPVTTILAAAGDIQLLFRARCETAEEAESLLAQIRAEIDPILGERIYSWTGQLLEEAVGCRLCEKQAQLAVAESCTGGLLAQRLTSVSGSSKNFLGGFVTYSADLKNTILGIDKTLLDTIGPVSEPVAREMALSTRRLTGADYALSITGFAGPDGGTEENPVGTVYIGLAYEGGVDVQRHRFLGDRERVRVLASTYALDMLRLKLRSNC